MEMLARRRVCICCVKEVRNQNEGTTAVGSGNKKYKNFGAVAMLKVQMEWVYELVDYVIEWSGSHIEWPKKLAPVTRFGPPQLQLD